MGDRAKRARAFRPGVEGVEGRALTAGGVAGAAGEVLGPGVGLFLAARGIHSPVADGTVSALGGGHQRGGRPQAHAPGTLPIGNGLGQGLVRLALPLNYLDYGVISIWNNTTRTVSFQVSASTFAGGLYYPFALGSGQFRSFYAPASNGSTPPVFKVALNPNFKPIVIPKVNVVFESTGYLPAGTAGRPYAINLGVNGLYLSFI